MLRPSIACLACLALLAACSKPPAKSSASSRAVALSSGSGPAFTDYLAYEREKGRIWVPMARGVGSVVVFDIASRTLTQVEGFATAEREHGGKKRTIGPNSVAIAEGFVYVGNRATNEICAVDDDKLTKGPCYQVPKGIDGLAYVAAQKEPWVTAPSDKTVVVLDASTPPKLAPKLEIETPGEPEGFAVDEERGLFYTNLEDRDRTLVVDVKSHAIEATWSPGCGEAGPRGLAIDRVRNLLVVACTDRVKVLRAGAIAADLLAGSGVDNVDFLESKHLVYAAAAKAGRLTVARLEDDGSLTPVASVPTSAGVRNAVADEHGNAYAVDPGGARLLIVPAP